MTGWSAAGTGDLESEPVLEVEDGVGELEQTGAGIRGYCSRWQPVDQASAEPPFQSRDVLGDGRLHETQLACGSGEAAGAEHGPESPQLLGLHPSSFSMGIIMNHRWTQCPCADTVGA